MNTTQQVKENFDKTGFSAYGVRHRYEPADRLYITQYPHLTAYAKCAQKRVDVPMTHNCGSSSRARRTQDWDFGVGTIAKAVQLIATGYKQGAAKIKELAATAAPVGGFSFDIKYDVAGDEPDIERFLSGDPDSMVSRAPSQETRSKVIRLFMPWSVNHTWEAREFENRGAAMLTIVQALDAAGYAVELSTGGASHVPNCGPIQYHVEKILIKSAEDHFNAERIAASLAHPAPFRRLSFATMEFDANVAPESLEVYGYAQIKPQFRKAMEASPLLQDAYIIDDDNRSNYETVDSAIEALKAQIKYDDLMIHED